MLCHFLKKINKVIKSALERSQFLHSSGASNTKESGKF